MPSTDGTAWSLFVTLADTLADDFEISGFLESFTSGCSLLLTVDVALLLLEDPRAEHDVISASCKSAGRLLLTELRNAAGPTVECYDGGAPVQSGDIGADAPRWPAFARAAAREGYTACHAVPLQLRQDTIGAINLLTADPAALNSDQVNLAQALADVATIGLMQQRSGQSRAVRVAQLQTALDSRVLIEQAKGVLAERRGSTVDEAFATLRGHARSSNATLRDTARAVVDGSLQIPAPTSIATK